MKLIRRFGPFALLVLLSVGLTTGATAKSKSPNDEPMLRGKARQEADNTARDIDGKGSGSVSGIVSPGAEGRMSADAKEAAPGTETKQDPPIAVQQSATYEVPWQSVIAGSGALVSTDYSAESMFGEPVIGEASANDYDAYIGAMYMIIAFDDGCSCPYQGDFDGNGVLDPLDLNGLIDALFFAGPNPQDLGCPTTRGDVTADGLPDPLDLNYIIDHLFFAGPPPADPCLP